MIARTEFIACMVACAMAAVAQAPRLARALPPEAAARAAVRERHAAALRGLFDAVGVPSDSSPASVAARSAAVEAVTSAITNHAEVGDTGIRADAVAAAVASLVSQTNAVPTAVDIHNK
jgi:hypothetical protein